MGAGRSCSATLTNGGRDTLPLNATVVGGLEPERASDRSVQPKSFVMGLATGWMRAMYYAFSIRMRTAPHHALSLPCSAAYRCHALDPRGSRRL